MGSFLSLEEKEAAYEDIKAAIVNSKSDE